MLLSSSSSSPFKLSLLCLQCKWNALLNANRQVDKRGSKWVFPLLFFLILLNDRRNWTCSLAFLILIYPIRTSRKKGGKEGRKSHLYYLHWLLCWGRSHFMRRGNKRHNTKYNCIQISWTNYYKWPFGSSLSLTRNNVEKNERITEKASLIFPSFFSLLQLKELIFLLSICLSIRRMFTSAKDEEEESRDHFPHSLLQGNKYMT